MFKICTVYFQILVLFFSREKQYRFSQCSFLFLINWSLESFYAQNTEKSNLPRILFKHRCLFANSSILFFKRINIFLLFLINWSLSSFDKQNTENRQYSFLFSINWSLILRTEQNKTRIFRSVLTNIPPYARHLFQNQKKNLEFSLKPNPNLTKLNFEFSQRARNLHAILFIRTPSLRIVEKHARNCSATGRGLARVTQKTREREQNSSNFLTNDRE